MANRYNRRIDERGEKTTTAAGVVGAVRSAVKSVTKLAALNPMGLLDGALAIRKSASIVRDEMKRNKKYRERIEKTESCQRKTDIIALVILAGLSAVMFIVNSTFCSRYLSWLFVSAAVTVLIACIGILYDKKDHLILGGILAGAVLIICIALAVGNKLDGMAFSGIMKRSLLMFLFCSIGIVGGLLINHAAAENADNKY